ncbi:outer membrane assembly protein [Bacteroidia bacterium]|nr:outer membrane assembly protein [Bacteroidia bacterium]
MKLARKITKITLIVVASLVVLVVAAVTVASCIVFSPARLTPIVVEQANNLLNAKVNIDDVDLTFFGSFPNFGIRINNVSVVNQLDSTAQDLTASCFGEQHPELLRLKTCIISVDVMAYLKHNDVIINGIEFRDVDIFAHIDSTGKANFDVLAASVTTDTTAVPDTAVSHSSGQLLRNAQLSFLKIKNANVFYEDKKQKMNACLRGFDLNIEGDYIDKTGKGNILMTIAQLALTMPDMTGSVDNISLKVGANYADQVAKGNVAVDLPKVSFAMRDTALANNIALKINTEIDFDQKTSHLKLDNTSLKINDITFATHGEVQTDTAFGFFDMDLAYSLIIPSMEHLLAIVPATIVPQVKDAKLKGKITLEGNAAGIFRDSTSLPTIKGTLKTDLSAIHYTAVPCEVNSLTTQVGFQLDLNKQKPSFANIVSFKVIAKDAGTNVTLVGRADDLLGDPLLNVKLKADADLAKAIKVADKITPLNGMTADGTLNADIQTLMRVSDATSGDFGRLNVSGNIDLKKVKYDSPQDTMNATLDNLSVAFKTNVKDASVKEGKRLVNATIKMNTVRAQVGKSLRANVRKGNITLQTTNIQDTTQLPNVACTFDIDGTRVNTDSIRLRLAHLVGVANLKPAKDNPLKPDVALTLKTDSLRTVAFGNVLSLATGETRVTAVQSADTTQGFKGWLANVQLDYNAAQVFAPAFPERIYLDKLQASVTEQEQHLTQCAVRIGNSDFQLKGNIADLLPYLDKKKTLQTDLKLTANNIDLNQLMRISEAGSTATPVANVDADSPEYEAQMQKAVKIDTTPPKLSAIMLPKDIAASFETDIKTATFGTMDLQNIKGGVTLADGAIILQELGVVAHKKAKMNLTAIYRTPESNHIFAGISYHLTDVELGSLQEIIPEIDTILPMLRSFEGNVDFHLVAQTYLDSNYNVKFSTLRAASSIRGDSLVVLDGQTFATISKYLLFKNKKRNMIDSLSVELVVFKNQIELYPFVIAMDRYKVAVGGKHNLDMTFNYHASILESPLPKRLGVDISGNIAKPVIKLAPCRYESMFVPAKKGVVQSSQMEIREQIRKALTKVKE